MRLCCALGAALLGNLIDQWGQYVWIVATLLQARFPGQPPPLLFLHLHSARSLEKQGAGAGEGGGEVEAWTRRGRGTRTSLPVAACILGIFQWKGRRITFQRHVRLKSCFALSQCSRGCVGRMFFWVVSNAQKRIFLGVAFDLNAVVQHVLCSGILVALTGEFDPSPSPCSFTCPFSLSSLSLSPLSLLSLSLLSLSFTFFSRSVSFGLACRRCRRFSPSQQLTVACS